MEENLIGRMKEVLAESRGIPGAEIRCDVIRPACIKSSVGASSRNVVPTDRLKHILRKRLESRGSKIVNEGSFNVKFTWQTTPPIHDPIEDLLGPVEVMKIVKDYERFLKLAAANFVNPDRTKNERNGINLRASEAPFEKREEAKKLEFGNSESSKERKIMYDALRAKMEEIFWEVKNDFEIVKSDLSTLKHQIDTLMHNIDNLRNTTLSSLKTISTFLEESEAGRLPRFFVLVEDDGAARRLATKLVHSLHCYKLQFLCECPNEKLHLMEEKYGLQIAAADDDGLLKRGLPYLEAFMAVAYMAIKVGAHVAGGAEGFVPDFTTVLSNSSFAIEDASKLPTR
ncbi:hypothetical protein KP509_18G016000 [Ceratopteris richardii]|nr:hypothetical protein KP509_18G016000 [Ceratopteris richardii]